MLLRFRVLCSGLWFVAAGAHGQALGPVPNPSPWSDPRSPLGSVATAGATSAPDDGALPPLAAAAPNLAPLDLSQLGAVDAVSVLPAARILRSWPDALELMEAHQPDLLQRRASIRRAEANVEQALGRLLPRLEVGVGTDFSPVYQPFDTRGRAADHELFDVRSAVPNVNAALAVTFSLADLARVQGAELGVEAEREALAATRHALVGSVASAVLGVLAAERVAERNVAGLLDAQERMRLTERLVALGKATALDALRFAQDLSEAQGAVVSAQETLAQVREELGAVLGVAEPIGVAAEFEVTAPPGCRPLARLTERADRSAARARAEQAAVDSRAAGLAYLPELRLVSQYEATYGGIGISSPFDGPRAVAHRWTASANLVWTVYEGGARAADVERAAAERAEARAAEISAEIATRTEYRRAARLVSVTRASLDIALQSLEAARKTDALLRRALELGTVSALEVVDAARRLRAIESTAATREVDWLAARIRARLALSECG